MNTPCDTTVDFVPWDSLGDTATPSDLLALRDAVKAAAERDKAIESCDLVILYDSEGQPSLLRVTVTGTTRADVLVERAIAPEPEPAALDKTVDLDTMIAWENGELDEFEEIELFQRLIDLGLAWSLQGVYGRQAQRLIEAGRCRPAR